MQEAKVDEFLRRSSELLKTSEADIKTVRKTLKAVHKVKPELVDPEIFTKLSSIADNIKIAKDANKQVSVLAVRLDAQETRIDKLESQFKELKNVRGLIETNKQLGERLLKP